MIYAFLALLGYFVVKLLPQPESYIIAAMVGLLGGVHLIGGML